MKELMTLSEISMKFGEMKVLNNINLQIYENRIHSIIGPNGAGKTTLFNVLCGIYKPYRGNINYLCRDITGIKPNMLPKIGISRSYQITNIFPELNVIENIRLGVQALSNKNFNFWTTPKEKDEILKKAEEICENIGLLPKALRYAYSLSHGEQRVLELGIALAANPKILLLDEPTSGMAPSEVKKMLDLILNLAGVGIAILLVEHNMRLVMAISDFISVLHQGQIIAEGLPAQISADKNVRKAYLGERIDAYS